MNVNNNVINVVGHRDVDFSEGLSRMLSGMCASVSKVVCSTTMAYLIVSNERSLFQFLHEFTHFLVSQIFDILDGKEGEFSIRTNYSMLERHRVMRADSSADDYLYHPNESENMCMYEYVLNLKKVCRKFKEMRSENKQLLDLLMGNHKL